ncbi:MAG: hypothetical protein ACRDD2_05065 [Sarcina sp.]
MKNKKGFVTITVVLWMSLVLSIVAALYSMMVREVSILQKNNKVKNYLNNELYEDIVEQFKITINYLEDIRNQSYYLNSQYREYKFYFHIKKSYFTLEILEKENNSKMNFYYSYYKKVNGEYIFERIEL